MTRRTPSTMGALLLAGLLATALWGVRPDASGPRGQANAGELAGEVWHFEPALEELALDEEQERRIERVLAAENDRVQRLEGELRETERALRDAANQAVFDEELAGQIVRHRAELSAYLWGTRARVESQVYRVLTPEQRLQYSELRAIDEGNRSFERVVWRGY